MREWTTAAIGDARASLLGWLDGAPSTIWSAPTPCERWTGKEVLAHLVDGELILGRVYRGEQVTGPIDAEAALNNWRPLPGAAVRAALWQHGTAAQRVLDSMTEGAWQRSVDLFGCRRVSQLARLHLFELAVHGWDLTTAGGAPALWKDLLPFLAEHVIRAAPRALHRAEVRPAGALRIQVSDLDRAWTIDGRSGHWLVSVEDAPTHTIGAEDLVITATGRALDSPSTEGLPDEAAAILGRLRVV